MQLVPGPIPPITSDWYDQTVDNPGFSDLEQAQLGSLPTLEAAMDALVDPLAAIALALPDDGLGPSLDSTDVILADLGGTDYGTPSAAIDSQIATNTEQIGNAFAVTPAEAWQVVPDPYAVPGQPPPPPNLNPSSWGIYLAGDGVPAQFEVGQEYQINVNIPPGEGGAGLYQNVACVLYPWNNQVPQPQINLGETDQYGNLSFYGVWQAGDVGDWGATLYTTTQAGQTLPGQTLYWTVVAAPGGPPGGPPAPPPPPRPTPPPAPPPPPHPPPPTITVVFANLTTGNAQTLKVGDKWSLTVAGAANSNVIIGGYFNGLPLTAVIVGQTDSSGVLVLSGQMSTYDIGAWRETFVVGSQDWRGELDFIVTAS